MTDSISFVSNLNWHSLPELVQKQAELCLLDLLGIAASARATPLSRIIHDHACLHFGGNVPLLFDPRTASPLGAALAGGMTIDAIDGHDGFNPVKGHIGCALMPGVLAVALEQQKLDGKTFLTALVAGYELGARLGLTLHDTVPDYHTSGAWMAVAVAGVAARIMGLDAMQTAHAMGIAEYHGPRSQMMRCIDHPTMLKDGSGWGAMAGVSAAYLARDGFTGAPAITAKGPAFDDLGQRWIILEQYYKPYPVCRWAQGPIEGVLALREKHGLTSQDVDHIEVATFHESCRLATKDPKTTEEAQYSTSYPCAVAMVRGKVGVAEVSPEAFGDAEVQRLSLGLVMREDSYANAEFPLQRYARVYVHLRSGTVLDSGYIQPIWTAEVQPSEQDLRDKFRSLTQEALAEGHGESIEQAVAELAKSGTLGGLMDAINDRSGLWPRQVTA